MTFWRIYLKYDIVAFCVDNPLWKLFRWFVCSFSTNMWCSGWNDHQTLLSTHIIFILEKHRCLELLTIQSWGWGDILWFPPSSELFPVRREYLRMVQCSSWCNPCRHERLFFPPPDDKQNNAGGSVWVSEDMMVEGATGWYGPLFHTDTFKIYWHSSCIK